MNNIHINSLKVQHLDIGTSLLSVCISFHIFGNGCLKFGLDLRGNQTLTQFVFPFIFRVQDSLTLKRNCFCNFHWGPFRMYLSDINFGLLYGFTSVVRNFIALFIGKNYFSENSCKNVLRCVCVLKNVLLHFEVLAHQYLLQFYMNLYA